MKRAVSDMAAQAGAGVQISRLANGFTIVTQRIPHIETAVLGVWFGQGSRDEAEADHGISHFLEHMLFKGTSRRTARQLAEEIEAVGGEINAATGSESVGYFTHIMGPDYAIALELLADMLLNPLIAEPDIERERAVILQEMAADGDEPEEIAYDMLQATAFAGQALGRPIIGTRDSVGSISQADLRRHLDQVRRGPHAVLSAAGAVDHDRIAKLAASLFSGLPGAPAGTRPKARYGGGRRQFSEPFEQSHLLVGFAAPGRHDPQVHAAGVLADVLGGGASSRLFQNIREDRGLCYAVDASMDRYADSGVFSIYAATRSDAVPDVVHAVADELTGLIDKGVQPAELARARAHMRMGLHVTVESAGALTSHLAHEILEFGKVRPPAELVAAIDSVDKSAIRNVAEAMFKSPPILVEVGSEQAGPAFSRIEALSDNLSKSGGGAPWRS